jgi:hypothetical protein
MFRWLKAQVVQWVERYQRRQIDALLAEARSLKAQLLELQGGKPIQLPLINGQGLRRSEKGSPPRCSKRSISSI